MVMTRSCSRGDVAGSALLDEVGNRTQTRTQGPASGTVSFWPGLPGLAPLRGREAGWQEHWASCG